MMRNQGLATPKNPFRRVRKDTPAVLNGTPLLPTNYDRIWTRSQSRFLSPLPRHDRLLGPMIHEASPGNESDMPNRRQTRSMTARKTQTPATIMKASAKVVSSKRAKLSKMDIDIIITSPASEQKRSGKQVNENLGIKDRLRSASAPKQFHRKVPEPTWFPYYEQVSKGEEVKQAPKNSLNKRTSMTAAVVRHSSKRTQSAHQKPFGTQTPKIDKSQYSPLVPKKLSFMKVRNTRTVAIASSAQKSGVKTRSMAQ